MSGVYNNWIKVQNPNLRNDIVPMESGGFQAPFYFGGSQVPINLGIDNSISGGGFKNYSKAIFKPDNIRGKGVPSTDFHKNTNIHLPRHFKML